MRSNAKHANPTQALWLAVGIGAGAVGVGLLLRRARQQRSPPDRLPATAPARVVVLGAGFAGLAAAHALQRRLPAGVRITLIDRHNYQLFTPLLYQVAAWALDPYSIAYPLRQFTGRRGIGFRRAVVTGIDFAAQQVQLGSERLDYDYLIISLGSTTDYFGVESARQNALPLKGLQDGIAIRSHVTNMLELATLTDDPAERQSLLTFVIVGGGATGVESAAALADLIRNVVPRDYPSLAVAETHIVLIEADDKLLGNMGSQIGRIARHDLSRLGVEVRLNAKATQVLPRRVVTNDGQVLATHTILWMSGVRAPEVVAGLEAAHGQGHSLKVDACLRLMGRPNVYAVGDNAHITDPVSGQALPQLAQMAEQAGTAAGENIARAIAGQPLKPFHFKSRGLAVALGRTRGIATLGGLVITGRLGGLAWRLIHFLKLTGVRDKAAVLLDWCSAYFDDFDTAELSM